jgi:hypothetical protein
MRHEQLSIGIATIRRLFFGSRNGLAGVEVSEADILPDIVTKEKFDCAPACNNVTGAACAGTDGAGHSMVFPRTGFEFYNIGTQTVLCPQLVATGLAVGLDETEDEGIEVNQGVTARSRSAFVIGTSLAFYAKLKFILATVADTDDCAFGFRKAEPHDAALVNYLDYAVLNVISGDIKIETDLNNGGTPTVTDTTDDWADTEEHTLEIYVSAEGVVTYKIDGAPPTVTAAFTFDDGDTVVPFFYFLHASTPGSGPIWTEWEVGLQ